MSILGPIPLAVFVWVAGGAAVLAIGAYIIKMRRRRFEVPFSRLWQRVLEQREVVSLGASHPRKVDVRICAATLKDLRAEVNAGRFREDLYYRIGRPEVRIPSLLERLEELPWLVARELARVDARLGAHTSLLEACALRPWPGNVRELIGEIRRAGRSALADGRTAVKDRDLPESAGREIGETIRTGGIRGNGTGRTGWAAEGDRGARDDGAALIRDPTLQNAGLTKQRKCENEE